MRRSLDWMLALIAAAGLTFACSSDDEGGGTGGTTSGGSAGKGGSNAGAGGGTAATGGTGATGGGGGGGTGGGSGSSGAAGASGSAGSAGAATCTPSNSNSVANIDCAAICASLAGANCDNGPTPNECQTVCGQFETACPKEASALFDCSTNPPWTCSASGEPLVSGACATIYTSCLLPCIQQITGG